MTLQLFSALVVDDDVIARRAVGFALTQEDFSCAYAVDGDDARNRLAMEQYDLVVTDLRMPNTHGHSLAVELLALDQPPVVVVHSSIDDPRLTKDLLLRGVDDVVYKPTNYVAFAAKVRALVLRRQQAATGKVTADMGSLDVSADIHDKIAHPNGDSTIANCPVPPISHEEFERRIGHVQHLFPLSTVTYEVFQMSNSKDTTCRELAATVHQDAALTAEILRLASCSNYNRNRASTIDIEEAVARVGFKKIGEIALALNAMNVFRSCVVPWLDADVGQARSLAARIALELLLEKRDRFVATDGMSLCAFLHPLGRIVLGSAFQQEYKALISFSLDRSEPLSELEALVFPESHFATLGRVLSQWKLPAEICEPLTYLGASYDSISALDNPLRTRVELVKLAIRIGEMAVGVRIPWDRIDSPPKQLLKRYAVDSLEKLAEQTKSRLNQPTH